MKTNAREVLLVGSVPLQPASEVFVTVAQHLGELAPRIPDGEQVGWIHAVFHSHKVNPALEVGRRVPLQAKGANPIDIFRLKQGLTSRDLTLGPYGYAQNAIASYAQFKRLRDAGKVLPGTRFQVTMPGPGTSAYVIELPGEELLPIAGAALAAEIEQIVAAIPAEDLTIQLDVAMEAEHEEYLRQPEKFDAPIHQVFHWTHAQMADAVAAVANRVAPGVELGIHICSIWHHDPDGGQDNTVLVDTANALVQRITRPIAYFHLPLIPEHDATDCAPLKDLRLAPETKLYLGLIHLSDGLEGARRRVEAAQTAVTDFGVGYFCGLGTAPAISPIAGGIRRPAGAAAAPGDSRTAADVVGEVLDLHRQVAEL